MLNVGDFGLIKAKIVRIETDCDCDNQIIYKVKMPIEDGWEEALFPIKPINIVETKEDAYEGDRMDELISKQEALDAIARVGL